jgi:hypothetical protein
MILVSTVSYGTLYKPFNISLPRHPTYVFSAGWANIGIHRNASNDPTNEVQTPNMNALAADGIELSRNYLFWYCSPSRSALQTGRNPIHVVSTGGCTGSALVCDVSLYHILAPPGQLLWQNVDNSDMGQYNPADPVGGFEGIPRNMTGIGNKLQGAGYSTHFYGAAVSVSIATCDRFPDPCCCETMQASGMSALRLLTTLQKVADGRTRSFILTVQTTTGHRFLGRVVIRTEVASRISG